MSVNMDTDHGTGEVDYSDFTHEQFYCQADIKDATTTQDLKFEFEPLADMGGLRPNQMAEIVALHVVVSLNGDDSNTAADSDAEIRGVVGVNLEEQDDITTEGNGEEGDVTLLSGDLANTRESVRTQTEAGVLIVFANGGAGQQEYKRAYRDSDLTGRGPVVDANDDFTVISSTINADSGNIDATVHGQVIYDIQEVDDARSEFALPS